MIEVIDDNTKIYKTHFPNHKDLYDQIKIKLEELFNEPLEKKTYPGPLNGEGGNCTFFLEDGSGRNLHHWPEFKDYLDFLKTHLDVYIKELGIEKYKLTIDGMWGAKYPTGAGIVVHHHDSPEKNLYGVLFYIKKPEDCGNLTIRKIEKDPTSDYEITTSEGDIVFLPLFALHHFPKNKSKDDRVLIGLHLFIDPVEE